MHTDAFRDASNTSTLLYSYLFILFFTSLLRFFSSFSFFTRWRLSYTMRVLLFVVINLPCGPESFARSLIKRRGSSVMFHFREGVCITAAFCSHFSAFTADCTDYTRGCAFSIWILYKLLWDNKFAMQLLYRWLYCEF